jgi:cold shock CspA family protein
MRQTGILQRWNAERGYGFIAPTHGGRELFVHISALPRDGTQPVAGETMSYELGTGQDGKPQAVRVHREAFGPAETRARRAPPRERSTSVVGTVMSIALVLMVAAFAYHRFAPSLIARPPASLPRAAGGEDGLLGRSRPPSPQPSPAIGRGSRAQVVVSGAGAGAGTGAATFHCDGRRYCSQMTSCAEATFFLRNCPQTEMDGDHDGVPCESQWCTTPLSR